MKPIIKIILLIPLIFILACGPKSKISVRPVVIGPEDRLYSDAEKLFQAKLYAKSLETFREYISQFPNRLLVDDALMKMGTIYAILGDHENARNIYQRLIAEHPTSPFILDAKIEILATYYHQGKYKKVIDQGPEILKKTSSKTRLVRIYTILGDTFIADGFPVDALFFYIKAYKKSKAPGKEMVIVKLKEAMGQIGSADIEFVLSRLNKSDPIAGYLMYHLGLNKIEDERYEDALKVLSAFVKRFHKHEYTQQAERLIEELDKKSVYSRYTLGCILPLTGPYSTYGNRALKGVELALSRFNSQGDHPTLKIVIKDTESDPAMASMAVIDLFEEHVAAIIGPIVTAESAALEAQDKGIPIITLTQKNNITDIGDYVFRNFFTPKMQVKTIVSFAVDVLGINRFAILYPDENYGTAFMNLFWYEAIAYGGNVVGLESYNADQTDFADPIKKLVGLYYDIPEDLKATGRGIEDEGMYTMKNPEPIGDFDSIFLDPVKQLTGLNDVMPEGIDTATAPDDEEKEPQPIIDFDAVFLPDAPEKAGLIIPQLAFHDVEKVYLFGTNLWHSDKLIKMARKYVQGAVMADGFFAESTSQKVKDFVRIFEGAYGERPGFIEAVAYDTTIILLQMLSRPDVRFRSVLRDGLMNSAGFEGVTGFTSFDGTGDVRKKLYLLKVKGEKFIELEHHVQNFEQQKGANVSPEVTQEAFQ